MASSIFVPWVPRCRGVAGVHSLNGLCDLLQQQPKHPGKIQRDAQAPVQVADGKRLLCLKFMPGLENTPCAPSGRGLVLARFVEKKDRRRLQTTSGGNVSQPLLGRHSRAWEFDRSRA